jgi:hypothetical protein
VVSGETIWISAANVDQATNYDIIITNYSPADSDTLKYDFSADTPITVSGVANAGNDGWTLEVTAAQTLLWRGGTIQFAGYVTDTNGRVFAVDSGAITVTPSPLATSDWTAVIAACDEAILAYAGNPNHSFVVQGITVTYRSMAELIQLRDYAKTREREDTGNRPKRIIRTRFSRYSG